MAVCTFFGHRDCPEEVRTKLYAAVAELIENDGVDMFYVGNQGRFDAYVRLVLRELKKKYAHIQYAVVLPYLPVVVADKEDYSDTMFPEELENVPPRFAVDHRNQWMVQQADHVVCYVCHGWGGAVKFVELARRKGKTIRNLWEDQ